MKSRSRRFPDPHEDWVDGSWTVDCVCGVNFDDGEEMVNCDECGVWVHTRCSRYDKGDELFTCDKCKSKNNRNDSEETEVAQLLVELPTKTLRMESSYPASQPARRPFRLWTEIPMEERVHVQGVLGGDPALFGGLSSIFSRELWKSTGYVPKKFNFKYREFPCWDENEKGEEKNTCENRHRVDNGAGMLFSMSKENVLAGPVTDLDGVGGSDEGVCNSKLGVKDPNKWGFGEVDKKHSQSGVKKNKSLIRPVILHSNKRKKEEWGASKDRIKKKAKAADKEADEKKGTARASKAAFRPTGDPKQLAFHKDRDMESFMNDIQSIENEKLKDTVFGESVDRNLAVDNGSDQARNTTVTVTCSKEMPLSDGDGAGKEDDKTGYQVRIVLKNYVTNSSLEGKDVGKNHAKEEEEDSAAVDALHHNVEGSVLSAGKSPVPCIDSKVQEFQEKKLDEHDDGDIFQSSVKRDELEKQTDDDNTRGVVSQQTFLPVDAKDTGIASARISGTSVINNAAASRTSETLIGGDAVKADELSSLPSQVKRESEDSEGSISVQKDSSDSKSGSGLLQEPSKSCKPVPGTIASYSKHKGVCIGKSSSSSSVIEKSSSVDNLKPADSQDSNPGSMQQPMDSHASNEKDRVSSDVARDRDGDDASRKISKEHSKYSASSKLLHQGRVSHSSVSKKSIAESNDSAPFSSLKPTSAQNSTGSGEAAGSLQNQCASQSQNKQSCPGIPQRGEKPNQANTQLSSKNSAQSTHPPLASNSSAPLSDEELALLLHQELNSSPRVPRIPRMRQPGGTQLASPAATSLLIKRTSSSAGKDHSSVFRRKSKDASRDGFRSCHIDDKATKSNKVPYSPDRRTQETGNRGSSSTKGEGNETSRAVHSSRKILAPSSTTSTSSGPCSSNEVNEHSVPSPHNSPRNMSDDAPMNRTLPGLINEIMSKGKRMTYEELCNAVLPHWPHLRKHNGERYAYSSHSQAVLDCLRNRHEWARLVDRGPKTNSSKKKRKTDAEESDENEFRKVRDRVDGAGKSLESQREDFPKGKRKARKRRRLALQGRGIDDIRNRKKAELSDDDNDDDDNGDDDDGQFSDSSEETMFSEDEVEGSGACIGGGETSASSEDTGT